MIEKGLLPMGNGRSEHVVKSKRRGKKEKQVKRLKIYMTVILTAVCISIGAAAVLIGLQIFTGPEASESKESSESASPSSETVSVPYYEEDINLILVNSRNLLPETWKPRLAEYEGVQIEERILPALKKMLGDMEAAEIQITLTSGYVSFEEQNKRYDAMVQRLKKEEGYTQVRAEDKAQNTIGKGGYSESQTGLSVTFSAKDTDNFESSAANQWLLDHSVEYGFIQRYPKNKTSETGREYAPNCYRYVGVENALNMRRLSMCFEEYIAYIESQRG